MPEPTPQSAEKDGIEFESVAVSWCKSANIPHLRYDVAWPGGEPDRWCSGHAPRHIGPRMRKQLIDAREQFLARVTPPEGSAS